MIWVFVFSPLGLGILGFHGVRDPRQGSQGSLLLKRKKVKAFYDLFATFMEIELLAMCLDDY